jgi:hypothetical protein
MTGQERVTFKYRWLLNRGDRMGMFDCTFNLNINSYTVPLYLLDSNLHQR